MKIANAARAVCYVVVGHLHNEMRTPGVLCDAATSTAVFMAVIGLLLTSVPHPTHILTPSVSCTGHHRNRFGLVVASRPQTPKHIRGGWSHYTDTSEPVDGGVQL
jgi:hypothetical protein